MGCFPSKAFESAQIVALQNQVRQLQQQLSAYQGGSSAAYAPPPVYATGGGSSTGAFTDVLFFPDHAMPCHHGANCRRRNCTYAHQATNLTK